MYLLSTIFDDCYRLDVMQSAKHSHIHYNLPKKYTAPLKVIFTSLCYNYDLNWQLNDKSAYNLIVHCGLNKLFPIYCASN